jgi:catechol 2,3-dioxygenase-like lactoylglutathione lyase family enzyme
MPIAHVSLPTGTKHFDTMKAFYTKALKPLGYEVFMEHAGVVGFRLPRSGPDFWLHAGSTEFEAFDGKLESRGGKTHIAFAGKSEAQIREWHKVAV